jgi:ATP-dependent Lon protease
VLIIDLAGVWGGIDFDEVAGSQFRRPEEKQIYKDYMEMGSFSRGSGKGTIPAYARFVFNGSIGGDRDQGPDFTTLHVIPRGHPL